MTEKHHILSMDLALIRWSVKCAAWTEMSAGNAPLLQAFLAGWCCRCIGASQPEDMGMFRDSFMSGWYEADTMIVIEKQKNPYDHASIGE